MERLLPLILLVALPALGSDPRYDAPEGYYSAAGNYTQLNPPDLHPAVPNGADLRKATQHPPPAPGESIGDAAIRRNRIPVEALPPLAEEYSPSADPKDQRGRLGWGEKLSGAGDLAKLGSDVAFATMANLFVPYFSNILAGSLPPGDPAAYAASQQILAEMNRQFETSDLFGQLRSRFYDPGARRLAENYEPPHGNEALAAAVAASANAPTRKDGTVDPRSVAYDPNDIVSRLDPAQIQALESAGIDVTQVVSGILSGTFDSTAFDAKFAPKGALTAAQAENAKEIADEALRQAGVAPGDTAVAADGSADGKTRAAGTKADTKAAATETLAALPPGFERGTRRADMSSREALKAHLEKLLNQRRALRAQSAPVQFELRSEGVLSALHGQNIFQIAHRSYRSFRKWRKGGSPDESASPRYASQPAPFY